MTFWPHTLHEPRVSFFLCGFSSTTFEAMFDKSLGASAGAPTCRK